MARRYTGSTKPQPNVLNTVNDAAMTVPVTACNGNASSEKLGAGGSFMPPGWGSVDDCVASNERAPYRVVPASRMGRFTTNETQNVQKRCAPTRKAAEASETGGKLLPQRAGTTRGNDLGPLIADRGRSPFKSGLVGSGAWPFNGRLLRPSASPAPAGAFCAFCVSLVFEPSWSRCQPATTKPTAACRTYPTAWCSAAARRRSPNSTARTAPLSARSRRATSRRTACHPSSRTSSPACS